MSMCLNYASPLFGQVTMGDTVSPQQRANARATRRLSRNDSHTIRHFNAEGIVDYCYSMHQSFHGHGHIIETMLTGNTLVRRVCYADGSVHVEGGIDADRWKKTQRVELLMA